MARGYTSQRIAATMRASDPVHTPDSDAAQVYEHRWKRIDGKALRKFSVLAVDASQARRLGSIRLAHKYRQDPDDWYLLDAHIVDRLTSFVNAVLTIETDEEKRVRAEEFNALEAYEGRNV